MAVLLQYLMEISVFRRGGEKNVGKCIRTSEGVGVLNSD
jgi:hypothetical protein